MTRRRWLVVIAVAGIAIFGLSFVNLWIVHERVVRGEGYRLVHVFLSAWRGVGMPVLTIGVIVALVVALAALGSLGERRVPAWMLLIGSCVALGLILAVAWPVSQLGHASDVHLSVGLLTAVGAILAVGMVVAAVAMARPSRRVLAAAGAIALVALVGGAAGRWWGLQMAEGTGRHWSEGSYERAATGDEPAETLTIAGEQVTIGDRWRGTWEWSGWTVTIDDDPACPGSRGTYHARDAGEENLRFVKVVDTCADGARAADLEAGIWVRVP
ncbi:MAG TPA: hypothetical protein VFW95_01075 [Candidatus Limnocylindria bacterium]|nr:hypothetical protein [Candidatus Limnocylindria bacterium]